MAYNPTLGRWMQQDPIGYVDGMSLYEYVQSDPIILRDPVGLSSVSYHIGAIATTVTASVAGRVAGTVKTKVFGKEFEINAAVDFNLESLQLKPPEIPAFDGGTKGKCLSWTISFAQVKGTVAIDGWQGTLVAPTWLRSSLDDLLAKKLGGGSTSVRVNDVAVSAFSAKGTFEVQGGIRVNGWDFGEKRPSTKTKDSVIETLANTLKQLDWLKIMRTVSESVRTDQFAVHVRLELTLGGSTVEPTK